MSEPGFGFRGFAEGYGYGAALDRGAGPFDPGFAPGRGGVSATLEGSVVVAGAAPRSSGAFIDASPPERVGGSMNAAGIAAPFLSGN